MKYQSDPLHGQCNYMEYKQKRIYINIGMEKNEVKKIRIKKNKYKLKHKIKCAGQYTVDLINNNIRRNVQEECGRTIQIRTIQRL